MASVLESGVEPAAAPNGKAAAAAHRLRAALARHGPALAGYLVLTAVFFWPVVRHLPTRILSDGGDGAAYLWNLWALPHSLLSGHNPFATDHLFYPVGALTAFNTNAPLLAFASWLLQGLFGLGVAANLVQLAAVVLSGLGAYLLAHHVTGNRRAAFVAGAAFTLAPYRFAHASHYDLAHLEFLPFGLLALLRLYDRPTRGRAFAHGAVIGLTLLTDLYYAVFLVIASAVVAAWHWRRTATKAMAGRFALAGVAAILVASPLVAAMVREIVVFHTIDPLTNWANADNYSADLFSWVTPTTFQRLWGGHVAYFAYFNRATGGERIAFPGFAVLLLAAGGAIWGTRGRRGLWLALAVVFALLSFGPFLHVAGWQGGHFSTFGVRFDIPMPYFVFHFLPVVNGVRVPGRFSVVGILALDVLAAMALARLAAERPRLALIAPAVALLVVVVEFFPRDLPLQPTAIPRPYAAIAADPGQRAVLEVPLQWRTGFGAYGDTSGDHTISMYYATRHRKPLVSGMVARYPATRLGTILDNPLYTQVVDLQAGDPTSAVFGAADLQRAGIGYVVYHRDQPRPAAESYLGGLHLQVLADDGTVVVWKVPEAVPRPRAGP